MSKHDIPNKVWILSLILAASILLYTGVRFIQILTYSVFFYYCSRPIYSYLETKISESYVSVFITLAVTTFPVILFGVYVIQLTITELNKILQSYSLPLESIIPAEYLELTLLIRDPLSLETLIQNPAEYGIYTQLLDITVIAAGYVSDLFLNSILFVIIVSFFLLYDTKIGLWLSRVLGPFFSNWDDLAVNIDRDLKSVFLGNILNGIITAFFAIVFFSLFSYATPEPINMYYPVLFGIIAGFASLIPVVGIKLVYVPVTVLLSWQIYAAEVIELWPFIALYIIISSVGIDFIPDMIIRPYITAKSVPILLLLFAYISGTIIFGFYGFFLAPIILIVLYNYNKYEFTSVISELNMSR